MVNFMTPVFHGLSRLYAMAHGLILARFVGLYYNIVSIKKVKRAHIP